MSQDVAMAPPTEPDAATAGADDEPRYGGFMRFEIELEVRTLIVERPRRDCCHSAPPR